MNSDQMEVHYAPLSPVCIGHRINSAGPDVGSSQRPGDTCLVSGLGDDVNPCSRTAPCKTFAGAISKTLAQGEINCLDRCGFGAVTITTAITLNYYHLSDPCRCRARTSSSSAPGRPTGASCTASRSRALCRAPAPVSTASASYRQGMSRSRIASSCSWGAIGISDARTAGNTQLYISIVSFSSGTAIVVPATGPNMIAIDAPNRWQSARRRRRKRQRRHDHAFGLRRQYHGRRGGHGRPLQDRQHFDHVNPSSNIRLSNSYVSLNTTRFAPIAITYLVPFFCGEPTSFCVSPKIGRGRSAARRGQC